MFYDFGKVSVSICCIVFTRRQEPPRTSKEPAKKPGTQRTPQNMILQIAIRRTPSTADKRILQTAFSQNGGAAVSRRMAYPIRSGPVGARGVFDSSREFPTLGFLLFRIPPLDVSPFMVSVLGYCIRICPIRRISC